MLELIEKQEEMMECLGKKLELSNDEIRVLREADQKRRASEDGARMLVESAEKKVTAAMAAVDLLQAQNERLEKELEEVKKKNEEEKPIASVIHLRSRVKELEFELLREQRTVANLQNDTDFQKSRIEQLQNEVDACSNAKIAAVSSLGSKLEDTVKELAELRFKYQSAIEERDHIASEVGGELDVVRQRSAHLETHCERLSSELGKLRKECKMAECRIAALVEENAALRGKDLERLLSKGFAEIQWIQSSIVANDAIDLIQVQRLLRDQSHLIAVLREEGKLLVSQMEVERKEYKAKVKVLKKENRELEERLQKLLAI
ncbi:unnamed protein product [Heligmosomoides polygyrus]|uniref:Uncharacterized protein n=1 Tax=Heligmosomoides polygyrus TaxID=6339 RepID=A0A3P8BEP1_HELPZ|nr:unnamed protein product [Heligmosomoides polygyrus]